jgi:excisionase family DNA binding protein
MSQLILSGVLYTQLLDDLRDVVREEVKNVLPAASQPETEQLLSVREAAELLDVCPQTVHEYKRRGLLSFYKLAGRTYLKRDEVLGALQGHHRTTKHGRTNASR